MSWKHRMWKVIVSQSFPTLFDPMDCSPLGSSVHEILQARILESVAISFSGGSSQLRNWAQVSFFAGGLFTIEPPEKPKNTGVGSLFLLQGIFPTPGIKTGSPALQADSLPAELPGNAWVLAWQWCVLPTYLYRSLYIRKWVWLTVWLIHSSS